VASGTEGQEFSYTEGASFSLPRWISPDDPIMTLSLFVTKNAFRNRLRSGLTILSVAFSLLLLTLMMTVWRSFYLDKGSDESAQRLLTRHKVSLANFLPGFYRERIRSVPGVVHVVPYSWFGGSIRTKRPRISSPSLAPIR